MSAESGIATFRDQGGLWANHAIEDVATPEGFERNPQLVLDFYNQRRREVLQARPNGGHYGLVTLEDKHEVRIITQNVDDLHERAGSRSVLHLHGELMKSRSVYFPERIYDISPDNPDQKIGDCDAYGHPLRPFIVWFGEAVPLMEQAVAIVKEADALVVIGTSLNVYPAASLLHYAPTDARMFLIDPAAVQVGGREITYINKGATEGVEMLLKLLDDA